MYIRALENRACRQKAKDAKGTPHRSWAASKHLKDDIPGLISETFMGVASVLCSEPQ